MTRQRFVPAAVQPFKPPIATARRCGVSLLRALLLLAPLTLLLGAQPAAALNLSLEPLQPIPEKIPADPALAKLGEKLFFDPRLSADNTISCAHCHDLEHGGVDGLKHSYGVDGREGMVNSPTVFNSGLNFAQFWDGRAATLEDQIDGPVTGHVEMDSKWPDVLKKLREDQLYKQRFHTLFDDGLTANNVKHAIAEFERTLLTPDSRFDRYLKGDVNAINEAEKHGYALFKSYGCVSCHQGRNVGGNLFQKLGVMGDYFKENGMENKAGLGRFNVTGLASDKHRFKVPSLRLVVLTAPYFHNGRYRTLAETIRTMAKFQLGRHIPDEDIRYIIQFLYTLPGKYRGKSLEPKDRPLLHFGNLDSAPSGADS